MFLFVIAWWFKTCDLSWEKSWEVISSFNDGSITGNVCHRTQSIENLIEHKKIGGIHFASW